MVDFYEILKEYVSVDAPEYRLVSETPSGINVEADSNTFQKLMWVNVLENGNMETLNSGLNTKVTRNVTITLFVNCIKENDGSVYEALKVELMNDGVLLYNWLVDKLEINQISYDTGVDRLDQNTVAFQMNFVFEDLVNKCDYFLSMKNRGLGLLFYGNNENKPADLSVIGLNTLFKYDYENGLYKNIILNEDNINDKWLYENLRLVKVCRESEIFISGLLLFIVPNESDLFILEEYGIDDNGNMVELNVNERIDKFVGENYTIYFEKFDSSYEYTEEELKGPYKYLRIKFSK